MRTKTELWRQSWRRWTPALVFCLLNLVALSAYRLGGFGDNANLEQRRLEARNQEESRLQEERQDLETKVNRVVENRNQVIRLYSESFSSQSERLTRIISEVRNLARQAGMTPNRVSYPEIPLEEFGLTEKAFVFSVSGSYADLRQFINSLELTESFLTLKKIGLSQGDGSGILNISLQLSTLFLEEPLDEELLIEAGLLEDPAGEPDLLDEEAST